MSDNDWFSEFQPVQEQQQSGHVPRLQSVIPVNTAPTVSQDVQASMPRGSHQGHNREHSSRPRGSAGRRGFDREAVVFVQCKGGPGLTEGELWNIFQEFGDVIEARVVLNDSGENKRCCFVQFRTLEQACKAMDCLDMKHVAKHHLRTRLLPHEMQAATSRDPIEIKFIADLNRTVRYKKHLKILEDHQRSKRERERAKDDKVKEGEQKVSQSYVFMSDFIIQRLQEQLSAYQKKARENLKRLKQLSTHPVQAVIGMDELNAELTKQLKVQVPALRPALSEAALDSHTGEIALSFTGKAPPVGPQKVRVTLELDIDLV